MMGIVNNGAVKMNDQQDYIIPVGLRSSFEINALSLVLQFDPSQVEVLALRANHQDGEFLYTIANGKIRISWYSLNSWDLDDGDALFYLTVRLKGDAPNIDWLTVMPGSEIGDFEGRADRRCLNRGSTNTAWQIRLDDQLHTWIFPNPFKDNITLDFSLPSDRQVIIKIYNPLGQRVYQHAETSLLAGNNKITALLPDANSGLHLIEVQFVATDETLYRKTFKVFCEN